MGDDRTITNPWRMAGALMAAMAVVWVSGCSSSPLRERSERTPYERYDVLRGQDAPLTVVNSFGQEVPDLRRRLGQAPAR